MEFYQFHPTALAIEGAPRFLVSEALRGEGAYLRNDRGERFMERYHPLLELAPRDVVARAIAREGLAESGVPLRPVYLDMRHVHNIDLIARFPGISAFLARYGLDLAPRPDPRAPRRALSHGRHPHRSRRPHLARRPLRRRRSRLHRRARRQSPGLELSPRRPRLRRARRPLHACRCASARLRLRRSGPRPRSAAPVGTEEASASRLSSPHCKPPCGPTPACCAKNLLCATASPRRPKPNPPWRRSPQRGRTSRRLAEAQALSRVAHAILTSALARTESRGAHFRSDHPRHDDANFQKHSVLGRDARVRFEAW